MTELGERRSYAASRLSLVQSELTEAERIASKKACVYATGSFGRGEAGKFSDLDLFIVGKKGIHRPEEGGAGSKLKRLDEILIKAELIKVCRTLDFPEFSKDGLYLTHHSVEAFTKTLELRRMT